jgi:hypothetical protein
LQLCRRQRSIKLSFQIPEPRIALAASEDIRDSFGKARKPTETAHWSHPRETDTKIDQESYSGEEAGCKETQEENSQACCGKEEAQ